MAELFRDRVFAILASGIDTVAVTVQLSAGQGARFGTIPGGDFIRAALITNSGQIEIVKITARNVDQLTITRNAEGGGALSFVAGDRIECRIGPSSLEGFAQVAHLQTNEKKFGVNSGTADDLIVTLPASSISALTRGMEVDVELTGPNTTNQARLKVILGATDTGFLPIVKRGPSSSLLPLEPGDLAEANAIAKFHYNPDIASWVLLNPADQAIPSRSKSADYTCVLGDANAMIIHDAADNFARTFTIPSNAAVPYRVGTMLVFANEINTLTIAITADTLIRAAAGTTGSRTLAAKGIATAVKIKPTTWFISGAGLS